MIVDDDIFSRRSLKKLIEHTDTLSLVFEAENAFEANDFLKNNEVDIIFLDVEMPEMTGLEFLTIIDKNPVIILVSSNKEYAADGFDNDVVDFLTKPFFPNRFLKSVSKALSRLKEIEKEKPEKHNYIFLKVEGAWIKINIQDINYLQAMADYVVINKYVSGYKEKLIIHSTMKAAEKNFLNEQFARVHRSFIVNLKNVVEVNREFVILKGEEEIPLGVTYKDDVMRNIERM